MKRKRHNLLPFLIAICIFALTGVSFAAVDPPHEYGSTCQNCHDSSKLNKNSGGNIDNTPYNMMCMDCHSASGTAMPQKTHSAGTTSNKYWDGNWSNQCHTCHNPHYQRQGRIYSGTYPSGPYLYQGDIQSVVSNTLTATGSPGWTTNQFRGHTLRINMNYHKYNRIEENTANTIKTRYNIKTRYIVSGVQFGIFYGKLMEDKLDSGRGITNSTGVQLSSNRWRTVKFFNDIGPKSLLESGGDADPSTTSVCVVCHTRTTHDNYGFAVYGGTFESPEVMNASSYSHTPAEIKTCWQDTSTCHSPPAEGFAQNAASCGECHGTDMTEAENPNLVVKIKNGTLIDSWTNVPSIYNHPAHVNRYGSGSGCGVCHYGGMTPSKADLQNEPDVGDYNTLMAFWVNSTNGYFYNTGTYYGFENITDGGLMNDLYAYDGYSAGTPDSTTSCYNTYCHGYTLADGSDKTPQWKTGTVSCGYCHNATMAVPPASGSHLVHVNSVSPSSMFEPVNCGICHPHEGSMSAAGVHVDGDANWGFDASNAVSSGADYLNTTTGSAGPVPRSNFADCGNLYCHSSGDGDFRTIKWGGASIGCDSCHNKAGDVSGDWSVPHEIHATDYDPYIGCIDCHYDVVDSNTQIKSANKGLHVNSAADVLVNSAYGASAGWDGTNCTNTYCHSDGSDKSSPTHGNVTWSGTVGCTGCHDGGGESSTLSAAHADHTNAVTNYACDDCHSSVVTGSDTINDFSLHVDLSNDVDGGLNYSSEMCGTTDCHGSGTTPDTWYDDLSDYDNCTICHGLKTSGANGSVIAANPEKVAPGGPGVDTNNQTAATDDQVGAHQVHLANLNAYSDGVACTDCHVVPTGVNDARHIDNGLPGDMTWSAFVTNSGALTPSYSSLRCYNTYCHGAKMPKLDGQGGDGLGLDNAPAWTNTAYLDGNPSLSGDCDMCHSSPPTGYSPNTHTGGESTFSSCVPCHSHLNSSGQFTDLTKHIDGIIQATGCTGCHGQPPIDDTTIIQSSSKPTGRLTDFTNAAGLHAYHYTELGYSDCKYCHFLAAGITNHNESTPSVHIAFGFTGEFIGGSYTAMDMSNTNYADPAEGAVSSDVTNTTVTYPSGTARSCNNLYCHSDGGNYAGTKSYQAAEWDVGGDGTPTYACDICHGSGGGTYVMTDVHPIHATTYDYACVECHETTVDVSNTLLGNHVNAIKNVDFGGSTSGGGTYSRPACNTTYCHSPGNKDSAFDAPNSTANWNDTSLDCDECHSANAAAANTIGTYVHGTHIDNATSVGYNIGCAECHAASVSDDTTVSSYTYHADRNVNVQFDNNINKDSDSPDYGGSATARATSAPVRRTPLRASHGTRATSVVTGVTAVMARYIRPTPRVARATPMQTTTTYTSTAQAPTAVTYATRPRPLTYQTVRLRL
jgi:predicted CxxxxCH...CXXCH cytochrome family protein